MKRTMMKKIICVMLAAVCISLFTGCDYLETLKDERSLGEMAVWDEETNGIVYMDNLYLPFNFQDYTLDEVFLLSNDYNSLHGHRLIEVINRDVPLLLQNKESESARLITGPEIVIVDEADGWQIVSENEKIKTISFESGICWGEIIGEDIYISEDLYRQYTESGTDKMFSRCLIKDEKTDDVVWEYVVEHNTDSFDYGYYDEVYNYLAKQGAIKSVADNPAAFDKEELRSYTDDIYMELEGEDREKTLKDWEWKLQTYGTEIDMNYSLLGRAELIAKIYYADDNYMFAKCKYDIRSRYDSDGNIYIIVLDCDEDTMYILDSECGLNWEEKWNNIWNLLNYNDNDCL